MVKVRLDKYSALKYNFSKESRIWRRSYDKSAQPLTDMSLIKTVTKYMWQNTSRVY